MANIYERLGTVSIEEVLPHAVMRPYKGARKEHEFLGVKIYVDSPRYQTYRHKGVICVRCGLEGKFFAVERHAKNGSSNPDRYHLNMYGVSPEGAEIQFTVDHIVPESKGGKRHLDNLQTMCEPCNRKKGCVSDHLDKLICTRSIRELKLELQGYRRAVEIALLLLPDEMAAQLHVTWKNETKEN